MRLLCETPELVFARDRPGQLLFAVLIIHALALLLRLTVSSLRISSLVPRLETLALVARAAFVASPLADLSSLWHEHLHLVVVVVVAVACASSSTLALSSALRSLQLTPTVARSTPTLFESVSSSTRTKFSPLCCRLCSPYRPKSSLSLECLKFVILYPFVL